MWQRGSYTGRHLISALRPAEGLIACMLWHEQRRL
jgi:hypothetical protein